MHAFDTQSKRALKLDIRQKFVIMLSSTSNSYRDLKFLNNIDNFHPKQGQYLLYFVIGCHAQLLGDGVEGIEVTASPSAPQCVFPFTYNEKEYTECVKYDSLLGPWCATVANYTGDSSFRYCTV